MESIVSFYSFLCWGVLLIKLRPVFLRQAECQPTHTALMYFTH